MAAYSSSVGRIILQFCSLSHKHDSFFPLGISKITHTNRIDGTKFHPPNKVSGIMYIYVMCVRATNLQMKNM